MKKIHFLRLSYRWQDNIKMDLKELDSWFWTVFIWFDIGMKSNVLCSVVLNLWIPQSWKIT
jgi:hypothetical protein